MDDFIKIGKGTANFIIRLISYYMLRSLKFKHSYTVDHWCNLFIYYFLYLRPNDLIFQIFFVLFCFLIFKNQITDINILIMNILLLNHVTAWILQVRSTTEFCYQYFNIYQHSKQYRAHLSFLKLFSLIKSWRDY